MSDAGAAITARSSSMITAAAGRPTRHRDWRKVYGTRYVGGSA